MDDRTWRKSSSWRRFMIVAATLLAIARVALAAEVPGPDGPVFVIRKVGESVYVGGRFTRMGDLPARNLARWDGTAWSAVGQGSTNGVDGEVSALLEGPDGSVMVGGEFRSAGGVGCSNLARWTGTAWEGLAHFDGRVLALEWRTSPEEGVLVVGGAFAKVEGQPSSKLAILSRQSGEGWRRPIVTYTGVDGPVLDLRRHELEIWVVGGFSHVNGAEAGAARISRGELILTAEPGIRGIATALGRSQAPTPTLFIGGGEVRYALADRSSGVLTIPIPGTRYSIVDLPGLLGENLSDAGQLGTREINALLVMDHQVLVGGRFRTAGGRLVSSLALWDGRDGWGSSHLFGGGVEGVVRALEHDGSRIWVGGEFSRADHRPARNLATLRQIEGRMTWEFPGNGPLAEEPAVAGSDRFRLVAGLNGAVSFLAATPAEVYAAGSFTETGGGRAVRGLGAWNGAEWRDLGPLVFKSGAKELPGYASQLVAGQDRVYLGGVFTQIGGVGATNIAFHQGGRWHSLGGGVYNGFSANDDYLRRQVAAVLPHESGVFVAGNFLGGPRQEPGSNGKLNNVARYSFADGLWHPLGGGVHGGINNSVQVASLAIWGGDLYVAGYMTQSEQEDGTREPILRSFARWNLAERRWLAVPLDGLPAFFDATTLAADERYLYLGGTTLGIYRWDGRTWTVVLPRVPGVAQRIWDMRPHHQDLYVITTSTVDGFQLRRFRHGVWLGLSNPVQGFPEGITSIALREHELFFGGQFDRVGGLPMSNFGVGLIRPGNYAEFEAEHFPPGTPSDISGPGADADGDGLSNEAEFIAGTDPRDASIAFRTTGLMQREDGAGPPGFFRPGGAVITFEAMPGRTYGVESRESAEGPWTQFARVEARPVRRQESVQDPRPGAAHRFYRVVTPARNP